MCKCASKGCTGSVCGVPMSLWCSTLHGIAQQNTILAFKNWSSSLALEIGLAV